LLFIISETFRGKKAYEANISYSVSQLYIEEESTPRTRENRIRVFKAGRIFPRADRSIQIRTAGRRKEKINFPSPPSLLFRSRISFETKAAYLYEPNCLHSLENEFGKLFFTWGKSILRKIRDKADERIIITAEKKNWFFEGSRKKDRLGRL
jgi:hypothetical protein